VDLDSSYVKVILNNEQTKIVRKSAICWFFGSKKGRLSTDRIQRVKGMSGGITQNKHNTKIVHQKTKCNSKKKDTQRKKNTSKDETSDETSASDQYSLHSDSISDDFSDIENTPEKNGAEIKNSSNIVEIKLEAYYAVFYDNRWYLGRIIKTDTFKSTLKFLHFNLDQYFWPKTDDIAEVENKYIFYGPVALFI